MDSIDFTLDAWLPSPGFLWLYGEDEPGVYLPWLGVRKSWLVAVFPFASGVICVGVLLVLQRAARWRRSSGRCLNQPRIISVSNPKDRPEPEGEEVPRVFGTEEENEKVISHSQVVQKTWTVIPSPFRPSNRRGGVDVEESGRREFYEEEEEEEEEDAVNRSTDGAMTPKPAAVAHEVELEVQEDKAMESSEFCLIFQPDSGEEDSAEESEEDQEPEGRTGATLDVNTDSDSEIVISKTTVKVL